MNDEQIIKIAESYDLVEMIGIPTVSFIELAFCIFPKDNFVFCIEDATERFVRDYIEGMMDAARSTLIENGISQIVGAKIFWINVYDHEQNPLCNKGYFRLKIFVSKDQIKAA
jgi:hypothetical protein